MDLIYKNFDGLDISFQGALPEVILEQLAEAKKEAQDLRKEVYRELGPNKAPVMVAETGSRGGYAYRFDTGLDGETWFVAHSVASDRWNIRISVKSLNLALRGYGGVKEKVLALLLALNATGPAVKDEETGEVKNFPKERISRFDYCFDFLTQSAFEPDPKRIVAHARSNRHFTGKDTGIGTHISAKGKVIETVRIGEMPNRQVILYNKSNEIKAHNKRYWRDIWLESYNEAYKDKAPLSAKRRHNSAYNGNNSGKLSAKRRNAYSDLTAKPENISANSAIEAAIDSGTIWRIEARAGKEELNKWNLRTFEDFEEKAGNVIEAILKAYRYVNKGKDSNPARWPIAPFWQTAIDVAIEDLSSYRSSSAVRKKIIKDYRENIINGYWERLTGNFVGLTAAIGIDVSEMPVVLDEFQEVLAQEDKAILEKKYKKAEERFSFIEA